MVVDQSGAARKPYRLIIHANRRQRECRVSRREHAPGDLPGQLQLNRLDVITMLLDRVGRCHDQLKWR